MIDDQFALIDLLTGYQGAAVVTAAHRLGVFDALDENAKSAEDLAAELVVDPSNLSALLAALSRLGLATESGDTYAATPFTSKRLGTGGDLGLVVDKEAVFADAWLRLDEVVRSGSPTMASWHERLATDPQQARSFLEALDVLARISGPPLHELEELAPNKRVLDIGGGLGTYASALAGAGSTVVLVDFPEVIAWAGEVVTGDAVSLRPADIMTEPACGVEAGSMDAALVSHVLHDVREGPALDLLRRAVAAVRPGGSVVVNDFAGDSGPGAFGPLFDVMMRVETGGVAHRFERLEAMMRETGLTDVRRAPFDEPLTVLIGERP